MTDIDRDALIQKATQRHFVEWAYLECPNFYLALGENFRKEAISLVLARDHHVTLFEQYFSGLSDQDLRAASGEIRLDGFAAKEQEIKSYRENAMREFSAKTKTHLVAMGVYPDALADFGSWARRDSFYATELVWLSIGLEPTEGLNKKFEEYGYGRGGRRVPEVLKGRVNKSEFIKVLGKTQAEALRQYGVYHAHVEHLIALAKGGVTGLSPTEQRERLSALLTEWGADPHSRGLDDNERTWREEAAEQLVGRFQDRDTGEYVNVPEDADRVATALLQGVPKEMPGTTITDAFKFYLVENAKAIPEQRKKQMQRFARAELRLLAAVGSDKLISELTKADGRKWRDTRIEADVAPSTIKREKNDLSAVIATAISELDAGAVNPFRDLKLPKALGVRRDEREALPVEVIEGVYKELEDETCKPDGG